MTLDRRNRNFPDRRTAGARDRRMPQPTHDPASPTIAATEKSPANFDLTVVEETLRRLEKSNGLPESPISFRKENPELRKEIFLPSKDGRNSDEELIAKKGDDKSTTLAIDEQSDRRGHHRKLVEANEQLVLASLRLQIAAEKIEKTKEEMAELAHHDSLTKLPNRIRLLDRIDQAISFARRRPAKLAILFLDLDRFKTINDSRGHAIGDQLLQSVAQRLNGAVRDTDTVSRHGGDEFVLLLSDVSPGDGLTQKIMEIHKSVTAPYGIAETILEIGATIGISIFLDDGEDCATLISNADAAMYFAKEHGRNTHQYYRPALREGATIHPDIEAELRLAIEKNEFVLFYQAQIDLQKNAVTGVEALIRWRHPTKGLLLPGDFLPDAQESGVIVPIGNWVLREACRQAKSWLDDGLEFNRVAVNISAKEFERTDFLHDIRSALLATDLMPHRLVAGNERRRSNEKH